MTDQHRCDSMADAMVPYGPVTANEHLRHAMRRDEWDRLPVYDSTIKPPRRYLWLLAIPIAGLVLIVLATMGVLS